VRHMQINVRSIAVSICSGFVFVAVQPSTSRRTGAARGVLRKLFASSRCLELALCSFVRASLPAIILFNVQAAVAAADCLCTQQHLSATFSSE
jgi:hypothetical protein